MTHLDVIPTCSALPKDMRLDQLMDIDGDNSTSCTLSHFREYAIVLDLVDSFAREADNNNNNYSGIEKVCLILEIYQEQPFLLDSHLERIIKPVTEVIACEADKWLASKCKGINVKLEKSFQLIYVLCKVRGYKTIERFLAHEIVDFQRIFKLLFAVGNGGAVTSSWLMKYVVLVWSSFLILLPFDIKRLELNDTFICDTVNLAESFLSASSKEREGASILLAKLITRSDICNRELPLLLDRFSSAMSTKSMSSVFRLVGMLKTMSDILSSSNNREFLLPYAPKMLDMTLALSRSHSQMDHNALLRKMCIKVIQRCGLVILKPRSNKKVFFSTVRSLQDNLVAGKAKVILSHEQDMRQSMEDEDEEAEIDELVDPVIESLLMALQDRDTIVRWSAAKGIGRICSRLPQTFSDQVVVNMLAAVEFTFPTEETENSTLVEI